MSSKKPISVGLLLVGNALLVVLLIVLSNQWWWQRLADLDNQIKAASQASEQANTTLLRLVNTQLPLHKLLAESSLNTHQFIDELAFLVLDSSRDYTKTVKLKKNLNNILAEVEKVWPESMDENLLSLYIVNTEIIIDIIYEVLETSSPVQLELLMEDSEETLKDLISVVDKIALHNAQLLDSAGVSVVEATTNSKVHIIHLEQTSSKIIKQSILFMVTCGGLILLLQWGLYYVIQQRLSGLVRTMRAITEGGSLNRRVTSIHGNDLIGNIGNVFNSMMARLQKSQQLLQEQIERAELATQAKSDFLANMSHEIRTPVHAITGIIHLMREQQLSNKLREYTDKAETASEALVHVINDVLDFSKITAGKIELEHKSFELLPSLEKQIDLFSSKFNEKNVDFVLVFETDIPKKVVGDYLRLNQILINLINNALKFTHSGSVQLRVSCRHLTEQKVHLMFVVEDTGIGIEKERIETLFDAFSQGDVTTTRKYGGTGLGLAISHQLSQLMEGSIEVTSKLDYGSTFQLNALLEIDPIENKSVFPVLPPVAVTLDVLCICSRGKQCQMLEAMLPAMGFSAVFVETLEQAQQLLPDNQASSRFGLILIDVPFQQLSPIERLVADLAEHNPFLSLPLVLISALKKKVDTVTKVQILDRPIKPSELFNTIISALGLSSELQFSFHNKGIEELTNRQKIQKEISGARVLLVEDVPINQQIASEMLSSGGLHVQLADNGKHALQILETDKFDVILMDLQMPIMGGIEATQCIRQQEKFKTLPIIALTANVMKGVVEECKQSGFNDYLSKPLDINKLWEVLGTWIKPADRTPFKVDANMNVLPENVTTVHDQALGIDLMLGLERVNGNKSLYCSLLKTFLNEYGDSYRRFQVNFEQSDFNAAEQLAHALKGVSANLGIYSLSKASYKIEKQSKKLLSKECTDLSSEDPINKELLQVFATFFEQAETSIFHIILNLTPVKVQTLEEEKTVSDVDIKSILTLLSQLEKMVDASDGEALDLFEQIKTQIGDSDFNQDILELEEHLNYFSFDDASIVLEGIVEKFKKASSAHDLNERPKG